MDNNKIKTLAYLDKDIYDKLRLYCLINNIPITNIMNIALREYLDKNYDYNKIKDNIPK